MPYKRLDVGKQLHWLGLLGVIVVALGLYGLAEDGNDPHTADDALALENTHHTIDLDILTRPADPTVSADPAPADLPSPPPLPAAAIVSLPEPPIITPALAPASDATPITPPPPMADTPTAAEDTRPDNLAAIAKPVDAGGDHDQADAAPSDEPGGEAANTEQEPVEYTCSMHPSFRSKDPDELCPTCAMALVPVTGGGGPRSLVMTAASMKLANSGCGSKGLDFSSGWNCTPMNQGWSVHSTISGSRPSGDMPENVIPTSSSLSRYLISTS